MIKNVIILLLASNVLINAQHVDKDQRSGIVSFISSQHIYVKFDSTSGIEVGDTLFIKVVKEYVPAVIVKFKSSSSCAGEKIVESEIKLNDYLFAFYKNISEEEKVTALLDEITTAAEENKTGTITEIIPDPEEKPRQRSTGIKGRFSSQSYSNFSNYLNTGNYQRWRHSFRLNADDIESTGLSLSTYSIFTYRADDWNRVISNIGSAFKVYDLTLKYEFDEQSRIWFGRHINRKISNISAVDGLQFEKNIKSFAFGIVAGSRPNFSDFGYNFKLFEYGLYVNKSDTIGSGIMENTLSVFEQTNDFKTDRRFIYLQHTNNIVERTSFFISSEIDLYKKVLDKEDNSPSLTSLFVSARYAPVKELSFSLSYDARKNVIYYETFKSFIDSVFENETRQGFRFRTNVRPLRNLSLGFNYGYRYRKSDLKQNTSFGGNVSYTNIPLLDFSTNLSFSRLNSSYLEGNIYGVFIYKTIEQIFLDISIGFRLTEYLLLQNNIGYNEKSLIVDFSSSAFNPVYISIGYEGTFDKINTSGRILFDLSLRF